MHVLHRKYGEENCYAGATQEATRKNRVIVFFSFTFCQLSSNYHAHVSVTCSRAFQSTLCNFYASVVTKQGKTQTQKHNSKRSAENPARSEQTSDHERQVDIVNTGAVVERTVMSGSGDVEKGVAGPEEAADHHLGPSTLMLEAPAEIRGTWDVLGGRVQEVDGSVQVGAL